MSEHCQLAQRDRVEAAAMELRAADELNCESVDVVPPTKSQYDAWTLDAVVVDAKGVPPAVSRELALCELTLRVAQPRGEYQSVVATA